MVLAHDGSGGVVVEEEKESWRNTKQYTFAVWPKKTTMLRKRHNSAVSEILVITSKTYVSQLLGYGPYGGTKKY